MSDSIERPSVLLLETTAGSGTLLRRALLDEYNVTSAQTSEFFDARSYEESPVAVIVHFSSPHGHGEVLDRIASHQTLSNIPHITISPNNANDQRRACLEAGAFAAYIHPCNLTELRSRIRAATEFSKRINDLQRSACIDSLTGIWNRTYFQERLNACLTAFDRFEEQFVLALIDLDKFKAVNDTFGHVAGDTVLKGFADLLTSSIRRIDVCARIGGEEFAALFPRTSLTDSLRACERIRSSAESQEWPELDGGNVTVSVGITATPDGNRDDPHAWLNAADRALYQAKHGGRNTIRIFESQDSLDTSNRRLAG